MLPSWFFFVIGGWALVWLMDNLLKRSRRTRRFYAGLTTTRGLTVAPFKLQWYTVTLNEWFVAIGSHRSLQKVLELWFDAGAAFGLVAMVMSVLVLLGTAYQFFAKTESTADDQLLTLTPVVPGINLPVTDLGYFAVTLLACALIHEIGHAVAAVREGVRLNGFGVFLMAVYPGAFVDLNTDSLMAASPWKRLRIFCAGVWHNFVIVVIATTLLTSLPYLLSPFYITNRGVTVTWTAAAAVEEATESSDSHPTDLMIGDVIVRVNNCSVADRKEWSSCILHISNAPSPGYCIHLDSFSSADVIEPGAHSDDYCCAENSSSHVCFRLHSQDPSFGKVVPHELQCLRARRVCSASWFCSDDNDCPVGSGLRCAVPHLGTDSSQRLIKVTRADGGQQSVLFLGQPYELYSSVIVTDFLPRSSVYPLHLPGILERLCQYTISLSAALALLNVVPCYALDGHWILLSAVELMLKRLFTSAEGQDSFSSVCLLLGTLLLGVNLIIAMSNVLF